MQQLTPREQEVAELIAEGLTNKEIAIRLGISYHTAKEHGKVILQKAGVNNRVKFANLLRKAS